MTARATGTTTRLDGRDAVAFERTFTAPIEDVWAAVTEPGRLERWIGTWTGDPASGSVTFRMTAEGEDVPESRYDIRRCEPPHSLAVTAVDDFGTWVLDLDLTQSGPVTTLRMTQLLDDPSMLENTGPGWDYYLDRLVAAETGGDVAAIDFERDYYPALRDHYLAITAQLTG